KIRRQENLLVGTNGDNVGVGRARRIVWWSDYGQGHRVTTRCQDRVRGKVRTPILRPEYVAIHINQGTRRIGPIDRTVASVPILHMTPNRPGCGAGGAVIL